jgi:4,5-DOPA dioxygenase extradiol
VPAEPRQLLQIGKLLAPLRAARVLIIGTGGVVHNLGLADLAHDDAPVPLWVRTFDDWLVTCLELGEIEALCEYRRRGPHAERACPTSEHLDPMFVVLGTRLAGDRLRSIYEGFQYGSVSLRSFGISQSGR